MSFVEDMQGFIDDDDTVNFFEKNCTYYPKHDFRNELFVYGYKEFYKNSNGYFVTIASSSFSKQITAQDFKRALELKKKSDARAKSFFTRSKLDF